jgi:aminoglycoside phosphotransferase (APT) family kinase protein
MDGTSAGSAAHAAHAAGSLLRRIHGLRAEGLQERSVADTLDAARRSADVLRVVDPAVGAQVERLLERLSRRAPDAGRQVTSHGDFHVSELIRRDGELAVLSVDDACRAAPARDLATFAADAASREQADPARVLDALVEGYGARPEALRWHLSALLLRRAERPFRTLQEDWPARAEELVAAADAALGD